MGKDEKQWQAGESSEKSSPPRESGRLSQKEGRFAGKGGDASDQHEAVSGKGNESVATSESTNSGEASPDKGSGFFWSNMNLTPRIVLGYLLSSLIAIGFVGLSFFYIGLQNMIDAVAEKNKLISENIARQMETGIRKGSVVIAQGEHFNLLERYNKSDTLDARHFILFSKKGQSHSYYQWQWSDGNWHKSKMREDSPYMVQVEKLFSGVKNSFVHRKFTFSLSNYIGAFTVVHDKQMEPRFIFLSKERLNEHTQKIFLSFLNISFIILIGLAGSFLIGMIQARRIVRPIKNLVLSMQDIATAEADFTRRIDIKERNELGQLGQAFNRFVQNQQRILNDVRDYSRHLTKLVSDIHKRFRELSFGAENQSEMIDKTSQSNRNMAEALKKVNDNAQEQISVLSDTLPVFEALADFIMMVENNASKVNDVSVSAHLSSQQGKEIITEMSDNINALSESSEKIAKIINIVRDVADQTRLLALNASIEAARAKEQGKGFAVVADEVSSLAEKSAQQVKGVTDIIRENEQFIDKVVRSAERSEQAFLEIADFVEEAKDISGQNVEGAQKQQQPAKESKEKLQQVNTLTEGVTKEIQQQSQEVDALADTMEQINTYTHDSHKLVEELNGKVQEINDTFTQMDNLLARIKL